MITAAQIRAGRALLRWSARELAQRAGLSWLTIQRMEQGEGVPSSLARNLDAVQQALERAGIVFIPPDSAVGPGVRLTLDAGHSTGTVVVRYRSRRRPSASK